MAAEARGAAVYVQHCSTWESMEGIRPCVSDGMHAHVWPWGRTGVMSSLAGYGRAWVYASGLLVCHFANDVMK